MIKRATDTGLYGRAGEAHLSKHDDNSERREPDRNDDKNKKDDGKDTSRHSVEHDKRTSTTPNPDDYQ